MINIYISIFIISIGIVLAKIDTKEKNIGKIYLKKFISELFEFIWVPIGYYLIKILNLKIESDFWDNINKYKDYIIIIILLFLLIEVSVKYRKSIIKYTESMLIYLNIGFAICWVIEGVNKSNFLNIWIINLCILINLKVLIELNKNYTKKNNIGIGRMNERICSSYNELFPSRQKQADSIIGYIESYKNYERFTLLLNGEWGSGKTSLIKGVEEKCKDKYTMIFIQPMMFDKKELLIKYFCERLKDILIEGNIYTGKGSNVERYLISLLNWVNKKSDIGFIENFSNKNIEDFRKVKSDLQIDINKYTELQKIIVIVDDFDRVDNNTIKEVLMFIREIIDFEGISTILLFQYSKITNEEITKEYLDKYIDKRIDLNKVDKKEMVDTFINWTIEDEIQDDEIKEKLEKFKNNHEFILKQIDKKIREPLEKITTRNYSNKETEEDKERRRKFEQKYEELIISINNSLNNIRLIKKIIREFIGVFNKLQLNYKDVVILTNDDVIFVFKFIIIKNLFIDEYSEMQNKRDFYDYSNDIYFESNEVRVCISKLLSEVKYSSYKLETINRYMMADAILKYRFDNIDYQTKTEGEIIIDEIDQLNLVKWDKISFLQNIDSKDDAISVFEKIYSYVYRDYYSNGQYNAVNERLDKLNYILLKYIKKYNKEYVVILLVLYKKMSTIFEQFELNCGLICEIFKVIKETNYDITEIQQISNYIRDIKINNLMYLNNILDIVLRSRKMSSTGMDNIYIKISEFNTNIAKVFALDLDINKPYLDNFDSLLFKVKSDIFKLDELKSIDKTYIYTNITKYQIVQRIIERIENNIGCYNKSEEMDRESIRTYIDSSKDWKEFKNLSSKSINEMLKTDHKFDYNDLSICYGILNGIERFIDKYENEDLISSIGKIIEKASKNKHPNDFRYIQLQNLILKNQEINEKIKKCV
ncbi:P-loop NTPase fold protein [Clostridium butyricum]